MEIFYKTTDVDKNFIFPNLIMIYSDSSITIKCELYFYIFIEYLEPEPIII